MRDSSSGLVYQLHFDFYFPLHPGHELLPLSLASLQLDVFQLGPHRVLALLLLGPIRVLLKPIRVLLVFDHGLSLPSEKSKHRLGRPADI